MLITEWKSISKSVQGKDIKFATLGKGFKNILLLSCFHGDEPQGKDISLKLLSYFEENIPVLKEKTLTIVPLVNPDGYEKNTRGNFNGVDLNRNFPTKNWQLSEYKDDYYSGPAPASEPETRFIIDLIENNTPQLIITLHQPYKIINYDGPAEELAHLISKFNGYDVSSDIGYPTPGSFGTYAGIEKNIPVITLELPENEPLAKVWNDNYFALVNIIINL